MKIDATNVSKALAPQLFYPSMSVAIEKSSSILFKQHAPKTRAPKVGNFLEIRNLLDLRRQNRPLFALKTEKE
jgi:hypothetical protein